MTDLWTSLKSVQKPIFLYGMGNGAQKLMSVLETHKIPVSGVFVSDGFVRDKSFCGHKLQGYAQVKNRYGDIIVLVAFGTNRPEVIDNIKRISCECELYAPDIPVYGEELFDSRYYEQHKAELDYVRAHLSDERSRYVFDNVVNFKLTGKVNYLFDCESDINEAFDWVLKLGDNEVFADLGAYRGDTVLQFQKHVGGYRHIFALEPDKKTFNKLCESVTGDNVTCINAACAETSGSGSFDMKGGRNSHISQKGSEIRLLAVDDLPCIMPATYIKMDVEGAELKAIAGAANAIKNFKPKLKIAAYHRTCDIFEIVKQVLELRDDYSVYMRHNPYIPAWDTDFYFI